MSATPAGLIASDNVVSDAAYGSLSPYVIDIFVVGLLMALQVYSGAGHASIVGSLGYLVASLLAVWGALRANAIARYIEDTPLSKIATAAQGFVELTGKANFFGDRQSQGFMSGPPCVWHRYTIFQYKSKMPFRFGASTVPFLVSDSTGSCVVYPKGAKIVSSSRRTWIENRKRYSARYLRPGADIYILGCLRTTGGSNTEHNEGAEVSGLMAGWKKDRTWLLEEFDANNDGQLSPEEWAQARELAASVVRSKLEVKASDPVTHVISRPGNGMPYLISDRDPTPMGKTFRLLSYGNLLVAIACFVWAGKLLTAL